MKKIDEDLGGTTPLNVIIKFPKKEKTRYKTMNSLSGMRIMKVMRKIKVLVYTGQNG